MRSAEQKEADDALTNAIQRVILAYHGEDGRITSEYIVITSQHGWDEHGDGNTAVSMIFRDCDVPVHRALGLVEFAGACLRKEAAE